MEPKDAAVRSLEIRSEGGNPVRFYETENIRPEIIVAVADGGMAWEGTVAELGMVGIFDKPGVVVIIHPHTKARMDAAIKKAERKFKPGPQMPLKSAPKIIGMAKTGFPADDTQRDM